MKSVTKVDLKNLYCLKGKKVEKVYNWKYFIKIFFLILCILSCIGTAILIYKAKDPVCTIYGSLLMWLIGSAIGQIISDINDKSNYIGDMFEKT